MATDITLARRFFICTKPFSTFETASSISVCASLSTHVLDAAKGGPRVGLPVTVRDDRGTVVGSGETDGDGRVGELAVGLAAGRYQITWHCDGEFLTQLSATVALKEDRHYHVPLLASPVSGVVYLGH